MSLVDPADWPEFSHPMIQIANEYTRRNPSYVAEPDGFGGVYLAQSDTYGIAQLASLTMDLPSLEAFREWGAGQRDAATREQAVATADKLLELCDWRWYAWRALQPGVVRRLDDDGLYAVRVNLSGEEEDIFESTSRAEATAEWLRLARMVASGGIDNESLQLLLSDEDVDALGRVEKLPPELMRVWRENQGDGETR